MGLKILLFKISFGIWRGIWLFKFEFGIRLVTFGICLVHKEWPNNLTVTEKCLIRFYLFWYMCSIQKSSGIWTVTQLFSLYQWYVQCQRLQEMSIFDWYMVDIVLYSIHKMSFFCCDRHYSTKQRGCIYKRIWCISCNTWSCIGRFGTWP